MDTVRTPLAALAAVLLAGALAAAEPPTPTPAPADASHQAFRLDLDHLFDVDRPDGHAEFDGSLRRGIWRDDPMVRLAVAVDRESAAARRGGLVGFPAPFSSSTLLVAVPGTDPRLVLSGPWADDWHDLSMQEKIGRLAEGAVYAGLVVGIIRALR